MVLIVEIFVGDIIFGGNGMLYKSFVDQMCKEFEMSMFCEIKFFIGLQVHQTKNSINMTQSKYINEILITFGMDESRLVSTPMLARVKLSKEYTSANVNETQYRSMIGKLQYVVHNRPDSAHVVGIVARFPSNPKETHMTSIKRISRYLKGT
jgi:hypothetical protein